MRKDRKEGIKFMNNKIAYNDLSALCENLGAFAVK
jgi:hypothetical protein